MTAEKCKPLGKIGYIIQVSYFYIKTNMHPKVLPMYIFSLFLYKWFMKLI